MLCTLLSVRPPASFLLRLSLPQTRRAQSAVTSPSPQPKTTSAVSAVPSTRRRAVAVISTTKQYIAEAEHLHICALPTRSSKDVTVRVSSSTANCLGSQLLVTVAASPLPCDATPSPLSRPFCQHHQLRRMSPSASSSASSASSSRRSSNASSCDGSDAGSSADDSIVASGSSAAGKSNSIRNGGSRSHTCATCGMAFNRLLHLQRHEYRHGDSRPFQCTVCPKVRIRAFRLPHKSPRSPRKLTECLPPTELYTARLARATRQITHAWRGGRQEDPFTVEIHQR